MKELIILGTGGNCLDILEAVLAINDALPGPSYRVRGFLDDNFALKGSSVQGYPVLGTLAQANQHVDCVFINGIGSFRNYWRKPEIIAQARIPQERFETIVHPKASVSRFASLGRGTAVLEHAAINSQVQVGNHVIILPNAVISHDVEVGDYSCIASAACLAGNVKIGRMCYLGANCSVRNDVTLGDGCLVGMGAVVLEDVPEATVVAGNPARAIRSIA